MDYYKVTPMIVPAERESEIRITPLFDHAKFSNCKDRITVMFYPWDGLNSDHSYRGYSWIPEDPENQINDWDFDGDTLVFKAVFSGEQEFNILIIEKNDKGVIVKKRRFHLYSLKEDLYALRPYRGNFHIHTTGSDGREEPRYVAARYRQLGMDFCAISDHRNYTPSITAKEYWLERNPDFKLYPGEEVHSPGNPVHIVNFGGKYSVHKLSYDNEEQYRREVDEIRKTLPEGLTEQSAFDVAASEWVFDEIRKAGGLCVFCHPYWYTEQYVISEEITSEIFKRRKFDAFELLGGHYKYLPQSNNHQIVRYYEECAKGNRFPVVGLDDSHGTDRFEVDEHKVNSQTRDLAGWYSTLVFAHSAELHDLHDSIRKGLSAAVEKIEGDQLRVYSDFRLTKYATFLMRWYFPMHDTLCADEGALMLRVLSGDTKAQIALDALRGSVKEWENHAFKC